MAEENAPVSQELDAPDVSLITTPLDAPIEGAGQGEAANDTPNEGAATQESGDKQTEQKEGDAKTTEAKSSEATDNKEDGDQSQQTEEQQAQPSKEDRDQAARQAWQERQRTRQQIAQQIDNEFAPKTADELIAEGAQPQDAAIEALRQEVAYKEERTRVSELNAGMRVEAVEVQNDFPVFRQLNADGTPNPEYDPDFTRDVEESYKRAARLQTNEDGSLILNADEPLYDYYQRMARIYNRGTSRGNEQGQQQLADQMARTENPGGSSSTNGPAPGSLEELEQRLADVPIT